MSKKARKAVNAHCRRRIAMAKRAKDLRPDLDPFGALDLAGRYQKMQAVDHMQRLVAATMPQRQYSA